MINGCYYCEGLCAISSECTCNGNKVGRDCSEYGEELKLNQKKNYTAEARKWKYAMARIENGGGTYNLQVNIRD